MSNTLLLAQTSGRLSFLAFGLLIVCYSNLGVDFVGLGTLQNVLPAKSFARSLTQADALLDGTRLAVVHSLRLLVDTLRANPALAEEALGVRVVILADGGTPAEPFVLVESPATARASHGPASTAASRCP